jgi:hypothetical protein
MKSIRDLIANDGYAMSFQSMGQYRTALLKALDSEHAGAAPPTPGEMSELVAFLKQEAEELDYQFEHGPAMKFARAATLLEQLSDLAADAVAGMRYIEESHGRLYGVGWDRVYAKADSLKPQLSKNNKAL